MSATTEKKKREKTVFDRDELTHVWAHQKATYGRAKSTNMYFEGPTIYSYGSHFPMARLVLGKDKKPAAVLLTTRRFSNTTSQHQSDVRSAVSHLTRFHVTDVRQTKHAVNLNDYRRRIAAAAEEAKAAKALTLDKIDALDKLIAEANAYAEFFKLKTRLAYPEGFDKAAEEARGREEAKKAADRQAKREAAERAKRAAQTAAAHAEFEAKKPEYDADVAKWLAGELKTYPSLPIKTSWPRDVRHDLQQKVDGGTRLRVVGSRIQTSRGAVFEVEKAKPLLALVRAGGKGTAYHSELSVDGYSGVAVNYDAKTVSVGCHTVTFAEVERVAAQLGL